MRVYFMGICGTAMGNAALLARAAGHEVCGSDTGIYPPMSTVLAQAGVSIHEGYDERRLNALAPDLVVIGNAQSRGNPEVEWLLDTGALPYTSLPAFLSERVLKGRRPIVVAGTHGKTTTTAIAAFLLSRNGFDPGYLIGGVPQDPPEGCRLGSPEAPFAIEGDEYDSAFFDKRSKFIHYAPRIAVLNNLEFDHADIFRDLADVQRTFAHFTRLVPRSGWIALNGDDENLRALGSFPWTRTIRVGVGQDNDVRIAGFEDGPHGASFSLLWKGAAWAQVRWALPGIYNARNAAMAATAVSLAGPGEPAPCDVSALAHFRPVKRRQEIRLNRPGLVVVEDFGHHPTAIAQTLRSLRDRFPGSRICAAFEPRSNTARTRSLQDSFAQALAGADRIYLGPVNRAEKLKPEERFDAGSVAAGLAAQGRSARAFDSNRALADTLEGDLLGNASGGDKLVVFFSNGSFDGIIDRFCAAASRVS